MSGPALKLYHHYMSVCAAKVRICLAEKGLCWEGELLDLAAGDQFRPEYIALNSKAVVPTLVHGNQVITESNVILEYLDDAFPEPVLRPRTAHGRARMRLLLMRLDSGSDGIHHDISVITYGAAYRLQLLERVGNRDTEAIDAEIDRSMNANSKRWLQETVHEGTEAESFKKAICNMDALLGDFETMLMRSDWLCGPDYSLADLAYTSYMTRLEMLNFQGMWSERPRVRSWYERLKDRSSYRNGILDWLNPDAVKVLDEGGRAAWPKVRKILTF